MDEIIEQMSIAMTQLGIDYHYLYNNKATIEYPYCTGEFTQNEYSYEDNSNKGDFLLELWNRESPSPLIELEKEIKDYFRNLNVVKNNVTMNISYNSSMPVRTNEASLYKLEIHLDISYWEGEN